MKPLSSLIELQRGHDLPSRERTEGAVPIIGSFGVTGWHDVARYAGPGVAIGRSGASIGRATYVKQAYWPLNTCLFVRDFKGNDPRWVYWMLRNADFAAYNSGSAQPSLNRNYLAQMDVRTPSVRQQVLIGEALGALDDKIAVNARVISHGRELLRAVWARCADESSRQVRLGDVVTVNPRAVKPDLAEPPYVDMKALPEHGLLISDAGRREAKGGARFMHGDTLMARITPCFENGKMAYVDVLGAGEVGYGSTEFIVFRSLEGVPSAVPYAVVSSAEFRKYAARSMIGTSGRQRVQAKGLEEYELDWPDEEKLAEFGEFSDALLGRLGAARDESQRLATTRDELLPLLMSGKITVKDAEKTVEEVV
ncbi:restriction endonuclease subunit S [Brachybacterium sp. J144]|uniref:restriction endonuclease subunit S n=1 Tax=Brachybacterium sp. J144 TaxID=3116487 RepID=UPI002E783B54|nr:restriction endonuclease subunit S [Brachybacterium sp. J144]MEE1651380.1 restriction endonuclease subunit S [Brachybacterium sp. J144]